MIPTSSSKHLRIQEYRDRFHSHKNILDSKDRYSQVVFIQNIFTALCWSVFTRFTNESISRQLLLKSVLSKEKVRKSASDGIEMIMKWTGSSIFIIEIQIHAYSLCPEINFRISLMIKNKLFFESNVRQSLAAAQKRRNNT